MTGTDVNDLYRWTCVCGQRNAGVAYYCSECGAAYVERQRPFESVYAAGYVEPPIILANGEAS